MSHVYTLANRDKHVANVHKSTKYIENKVPPTKSNPPTLSPASIGQSGNNSILCDLSKHQRKVKIKTIGLVHNYIILANC